MRAISFYYTKEQVQDGTKTVTRRRWKDRYALTYHAGDVVMATDKQRQYGGKDIREIRLTVDPYQERLGDMPVEDVAKEGFLGMSKNEFIDKFFGDPNEKLWVIRFEYI